MRDALDEQLKRFLDDHEAERRGGVTLETVFLATQSCANKLLELEQRETAWREELRVELLSATLRIRNVEAELVTLKTRVDLIEQLQSKAPRVKT